MTIATSIAEASSTKHGQEHLQAAFSAVFEASSLLHLSNELQIISQEAHQALKRQLDGIAQQLKSSIHFEDDHEKKETVEPYFAHPSATIDPGATIGKGTRIWHYSHIMSRAIIGAGCSLGQNVMVADHVTLGDNVKVQNNVSLYTGVTCEDDVFIGPSVVFTNVTNPRSAIIRKNEFLKTLVKKGATIGANATIVCGHDIGNYAFIGAGAVVTKAVPDYALLVGTPARQIGWMSANGHRLNFGPDNIAVCPGSGDKYVLKDGSVEAV